MANVLTALAPVVYSAARITPRLLTGTLGAVTRDWNDQGVAKGNSVKVTVAPRMTVQNVTVGQQFTVGADRTPTTVDFTMNNEKEVTWNLTGEEERSLMNSGTAQDLFKQTIENGIKELADTIESYVWGVAKAASSRAYGTPGTTPFATAAEMSDFSQVRKILKDNGVSDAMDSSLVIDTTAGANLGGKQSQLFKVNESGSDALLRDGKFGRYLGFAIRESAAVTTHTKGTGASYTTNAAGYAVGATSLTLITGTGTILAGDVITIAGDTNKYVVKTALSGGVVVLQDPGLRVAIAASATAVTVGNTYTGNIAIARNAVAAVVRPSIQPAGAAVEQMTVTDEQTGLSFLLLRVPGNGLASWYMRCVYDAFAPNPYGIATLLG